MMLALRKDFFLSLKACKNKWLDVMDGFKWFIVEGITKCI